MVCACKGSSFCSKAFVHLFQMLAWVLLSDAASVSSSIIILISFVCFRTNLYLCKRFTHKPIMSTKHKRKTAVPKTERPTMAEGVKTSLSVDQQAQPMRLAVSIGIAVVVSLVVVALSFYYLVAKNSDVLFMAQAKNFFTTNDVFLAECMRLPGGFISWLASFLTQFFYHPWLGVAIMVSLWIASMWISKVAFKVKSSWMAVLAIPVICLLVSTIDTGYWLYYQKQIGYWFYGTVGYFFTTVLVLFHSLLKKRMDRLITTFLITLTYPFLGWYTLLALVYISFIALTQWRKEKSMFYRIGLPVLSLGLALLIPLVCYHLYADIRSEDVWTVGLPVFAADALVSQTPAIPFYVLSFVPILFPFLPRGIRRQGIICVVTIVVLAGCYWWVEKSDFKNYNYHAEMRMYRAADEGNWDALLDEMGNIPGNASRQMVLLKNVALLNKGEMGTKMFKYNNMSEEPTNGFDTLHVHLVQTSAPLIYYYHGKTNFASRWCIENTVEYGSSFDDLKVLARCALIGGEMDLARKYLAILQTSIYYREWADRLMPIVNRPSLIKKYHEFDTVRELYDHMGSVLDGDNGYPELYLLQYFSNTMNKDSKLLQELTLNYALVQKDIQLFWPRFFLYATLHEKESMPVHYQEAAILYGNLEMNNVDISHMPFDEDVRTRFQNFQQMSQSLLGTGMKVPEVGEAMKSTHGGTFWWFYFFSNNLKTY